MSLLDRRDTYRPFNYPKALEYWLKHEQAHWLHTEAEFSDDKHDWDSLLTEGEKNLLSKLFRFFTQTDVDVGSGYYDKIIPVLGGQPEVKMMLGSFAAREGIHQVAYAKVLDTIGMPDSEFEAFKQHKQMLAKHDYLNNFKPQLIEMPCTSVGILMRKREIAKLLACYSAFTEGLSLFSSFAILMNFSRQGKMKGMNKIVEWSVRDELMHVEGMTWLFRTFIKENSEIWTDEFKKEIYDICRDIVKLEDAFIDLCFKEAGEIQGLTAEEVKRYIRFTADRRLADIGLKSNYHIKENPLPWMEWMLADSHNNFFEQKKTEYSKIDDNDWEGAFD
jgi:ribonucleoside-diphosphate reductase beta chain